ncbi:MAG TPA: helix-turn-helix domain-containing protein [Kofleriaceae bacterium]|nr:helix-turn-helix domain-containing protein [Kofleriaceae bacterium]
MSPLFNERALRELVRDEIRKAIAEATAPDEYLTVGDAANLARVHERTIRRLIEAGKLTDFRVGRVHRVSRKELEQYMRHGWRRPQDSDELSPEEMAERAFGG